MCAEVIEKRHIRCCTPRLSRAQHITIGIQFEETVAMVRWPREQQAPKLLSNYMLNTQRTVSHGIKKNHQQEFLGVQTLLATNGAE